MTADRQAGELSLTPVTHLIGVRVMALLKPQGLYIHLFDTTVGEILLLVPWMGFNSFFDEYFYEDIFLIILNCFYLANIIYCSLALITICRVK